MSHNVARQHNGCICCLSLQLTCICLPTCLPICLPALPANLPANLRACQLACQPANLPANLPVFACQLACQLSLQLALPCLQLQLACICCQLINVFSCLRGTRQLNTLIVTKYPHDCQGVAYNVDIATFICKFFSPVKL